MQGGRGGRQMSSELANWQRQASELTGKRAQSAWSESSWSKRQHGKRAQANELRADELPVACMANELRAHGSERQHGKQAHMANKLRAGELRAESW